MKGIYKIKNTINDKVYIGESKDIEHRLNSHLEHLLKGSANYKIQADANEFGLEAFEFSVVYVLPESVTGEELVAFEDYFIDYYDSICSGYNIQKSIVNSDVYTVYENLDKQKIISARANITKLKDLNILVPITSDYIVDLVTVNRIFNRTFTFDDSYTSAINLEMSEIAKSGYRLYISSNEVIKFFKSKNIYCKDKSSGDYIIAENFKQYFYTRFDEVTKSYKLILSESGKRFLLDFLKRIEAID